MRTSRTLLAGPVLIGLALAAAGAAPRPGPATLTAQVLDGTSPACTGTTLQVVPAVGALTDPDGGQGGHFWWTSNKGSNTICIGTIVIWAHYTKQETGIFWYKLYDSVPGATPPVHLIGQQASFTLGPGWYYWSFPVHRLIGSGQNPDVCIAAAFPSGESSWCVTVG
jgi:hypothetical protein